SIRQVPKHHMLVGIDLGGVLEAVARDIPIVSLGGLLAGVEGVVELLVLRHRRLRFLVLFFYFLFFLSRQRAAAFVDGGASRSLGEVEADVRAFANLGAGGLGVAILAVYFNGDFVVAERKATVEIVPLLVRLDLIVAFDVLA